MRKEDLLINESTPFLTTQDHLVTQDNFELLHHSKYDMLVTSPVPSNLEVYYDSPQYKPHQQSNKGLTSLLYNLVRKYSLKRKYKLIAKAGGGSILDIGAGTGEFLEYCHNQKWITTGVEPNEKALDISAKKQLNVFQNFDDVTTFQYDVITMWHVLEHVTDLYKYIESLKNILYPKGRIFIAVPNYKSFDAIYYKDFWAAYDVPRHLWHFSQTSIDKLFDEVGMKVVKKHPMIFDSFYVSLLSEKYRTGKSNYFKAFRAGLKSNQKAKITGEYSSIIYEVAHN